MLELIQVDIQVIINLLSRDPYPDEKMKQAKFLLIRLKNNLRRLKSAEARQIFLSAKQSYETARAAQMRRNRTQARDRKVSDQFQVLQMHMDKWIKD